MNGNRNILPDTHVKRMVEEKTLRNIVFCIILSVLVAAAAILSPAFSSLLNKIVTIKSTGTISTSSITAKSGSIDDLQVAIDTAHANGIGTVHIPAGTFVFNPNGTMHDGTPAGVTSFGGINIIGAGSDKTILQETVDTVHTMIHVDGSNGLPYEISGIRFQGYVGSESYSNTGIVLQGSTDYRVDNCWFDSFSGTAVIGQSSVRGVVDHNNFSNSYKTAAPGNWTWGYGVLVWDLNPAAWSSDASLLGQYYGATDIVYVEYNNFTQMRHCVTNSQNGYYVARFNTITNEIPWNFGSIDVHGFNDGRGCEAYNNTITATPGYNAGQAAWLRGGTNTVFNNTFVNEAYGVIIEYEGGTPRDDPVNNTYIWSNTMVGGGAAFSNGAPATYTENVNYFLYARPGYTPFTYPHPLTL
jgi:hypothetical protein